MVGKGTRPHAPFLGTKDRGAVGAGFTGVPLPCRFPGAPAELGPDRGLGLLPGDRLLLVRAQAAEARQPRALGL